NVPAWSRRWHSATCCTSAEATPLRSSRESRRFAPTNMSGIRSSLDLRTFSSISWTIRKRILRDEKGSHIFDSPVPRDAGEGIHSDAPGSSDVRDDDRHSLAPVDSVRLCHQCRSETFARGGSRGRSGPSRSHFIFGASEQQLLRSSASGKKRSRRARF